MNYFAIMVFNFFYKESFPVQFGMGTRHNAIDPLASANQYDSMYWRPVQLINSRVSF